MTNEELVQEIQAGRKELIETLWEQTERFIGLKAGQYYRLLNGKRGVTEEDLRQSGFFALVDAADKYDPTGGASFCHFLTFYLHKEFTEAAHLRTDRTKSDPLNDAISLDTPIGEDGDSSIIDLQEDPQDDIEDAEHRLYIEQLREALEAVLDKLQPEIADTIRQRYFQNKTLKEVAAEKGVSLERIRQREAKGLRILRQTAKKNGLDEYIEIRINYFKHTNFNHSFYSPVESLVELRERLEREFEEKQRRRQENGGKVWRRHRKTQTFFSS